ncbi:MAG: sialidase family protein [Mycobacteriales bacterium]
MSRDLLPARVPSRRSLLLTLAAAAALIGAVLAGGELPPQDPGAAGQPQVLDEVAVTAMNQIVGVSNNSPMILADPAEPRFVVMANRLDAPDFSCALQVSGDAGRSWVSARPVPVLPAGAQKCYAPEVAFDRAGRLHYLFVGLAGAGNEPVGVFLTTSEDRGRTFTEPRQVLGARNYAVRMAVDPELGETGRLHLVWLAATSEPSLGGFGPPPNPILTAYSDDGGRTFTDPVQVSDPARERVVAPALALGPDSSVHVGFYDLGRDAIDYQGLEGAVWEQPWTLLLSTSRDGGRRFEPARVVDAQIAPPERVMLIFTMAPAALVAGSGGLVCAAWTDARNGDADSLARCSPDHGRTWQDITRLNDDPLGNGARQYLPRLSLSPQGRLDAVFFDRRDDPANVLNHLYLTWSADGGRSFTPNAQISRAPSDTQIGQQYVHASARGQYEIGARLGLLSQRVGAVAVWPDTRHSESGGTGQDLFAATVGLPDAGRRFGTVEIVGTALILAVLIAVATLGRRHRRQRSQAAA